MRRTVEIVLLGWIPGGLLLLALAGRLLARPCDPRPLAWGALCGLNTAEGLWASWLLVAAVPAATLWAVGEIRRLELKEK